MADSVRKDGGDNSPDFTASHPPHVERGPGAMKPNDTTAWRVPGEVPAKPNPGGNGFVPGKWGPK